MGKHYTVRLEEISITDPKYGYYKIVKDKIDKDLCDVDATTIIYNSPMLYTPSKNNSEIYGNVLGIKDVWEYVYNRRKFFKREKYEEVRKKRPFPIICTIDDRMFTEIITGERFEINKIGVDNKLVFSDESKLALQQAGLLDAIQVEKLLRLLSDEGIKRYIEGINKLKEGVEDFSELYNKRINPEEDSEKYIKSIKEKYSK